MQRVDAVPFLAGVLTDGAEDPITRHEAAEALGAIEAPESLAILERYAADGASEVSSTCQLALSQLHYKIEKGACGCERRPQEALLAEAAEGVEGGPATGATTIAPSTADVSCEWRPAAPDAPLYHYISPAPAAKAAPVAELREQLLNRELPLFERYRALFALRDAVPKERERALAALCACLSREGDESALLKHEVAFVLGQLEDSLADDALCEAVARESEHGMVRHEAAEALGAIGSPKAVAVLQEYAAHPVEILRESCWVALMWLL
jgi:deoxyhypusine monooxygenase